MTRVRWDTRRPRLARRQPASYQPWPAQSDERDRDLPHGAVSGSAMADLRRPSKAGGGKSDGLNGLLEQRHTTGGNVSLER